MQVQVQAYLNLALQEQEERVSLLHHMTRMITTVVMMMTMEEGGGISGTHTSVETVEAVMYVDGFTEDMDSLTVLEQSPGPGATSESAINDANAKVNPSNSTLPLPATHIHINMPVTVGGVSANNSAQASTNTIDVLQARLAALRK